MTDAPSEPPPAQDPPARPDDAREPGDSPQRRLVEQVRAYEVDPPPPGRAAEEDPADDRT